jgi:hypothetical protein
MICAEFQRVLPEMLAGKPSTEQQAHLESCFACSDLVSDLDLISQQARFLQADEDPNPRVWSSLEIALRQEGLIREDGLMRRPQPASVVVPFFPRWRPAWTLALTAAFLVAFGALLHELGTGRPQTVSYVQPPIAGAPDLAAYSPEDQTILAEVNSRSPGLRPAYEANIQKVNAYIRDAEDWAKSNPNDEEAQQYLMNAYEQRSVVYAMALDRSLP